VGRHVADRPARGELQPVGDHLVQPEQQHVALTEAGGELVEVQREDVLRATALGEDEVVAPGGGVQHGGDPVGDAQLRPDLGADPVPVR
jgi:hypothetical protein